MPPQLNREDYTVGWVCTLPIELAAAKGMLDEEHSPEGDLAENDENYYILGSVCGHNVAIVCLPDRSIGNAPPMAVTAQMLATFKGIRVFLVVGIGGGVPSEEVDIRLGDVVVSMPDKASNGVVQYDIGKATPGGVQRIDSLDSPPWMLFSAVIQVQTNEFLGTSRLAEHMSKLEHLPTFQRSKTGPDILFESAYEHQGGQTCSNCSADKQKDRKPRDNGGKIVVTHYGTIASGNQVIRNATQRDRLSADLGGVLCFDMGAAGLMDGFPCLVVRGISHYADSHKNNRWQAYAAGTAAAWAKEVLSVIPPAELVKAHTADEVMTKVHAYGIEEEDSQPLSLKYSSAQASTIPTTVSHTHGFSDIVWSSTGKNSEIVTDHTTQDSASNPPNKKQKIASPELSSAHTVYAPSATLTTPAQDAGLSWIVGSTPADFKTRDAMHKVRKSAMVSYLKIGKSRESAKPRAGSEASEASDKGYTGELAKQLFKVVSCINPTRDALIRISQSLPDLLRAFAVKVGYRASSNMHCNVMFYVQKDCVSVQQAFQRLVDDTSQPKDSVKVEEEQQQDDSHEKSKLFEFILQTPVYKWLVDTLKRETTLKRAIPDLMEHIGAQIRDILLDYRDTLRSIAPSQEYEATFELSWNPLHYLKDQLPQIDAEEALGGAITLTGTVNDAQALTALEYLCQVWPDSGMHVMQLITDIACQDSKHIATASLPDGTQFQARIEDAKLIVNVVGSSESLAEAGQQLAWLGAALQLSPVETGIALCVPYIRECYLIHDPPLVKVSGRRQRGDIFCSIGFEVEISHVVGIEESGLCWHKMFASPILVGGFPILSKPEPKLGLEMPLDLLAGMVGASQVLGIQGKVFLKGFSTMLVGVRCLDDLLIWHFSFDEKGNRISYSSVALEQACDMSVDKIDDVRHVVGWSAKSSYYAGAEDADYDIKGTDLPPPRAGALLEKFSFNLGKIFTAGATIAPRVKQISPHFTRDVYEQKLMWIEKKYVVLWDEETKRGWLINGTSALLHLVRMSLKSYKRDYSQELLFDESMMQNEAGHDATSARKVLKNERNRDLEVWRGKNENVMETEPRILVQNQPSASRKMKKSRYTFENLVEQKWSVLEVLMESHKQLEGLNGINLKLRIRRHLEGWNFEDLAGESDPEPRVATLQAMGYGWVDFVHSLKAITLFGSGFGNIIRPSKCERICSQWSQLPKGKYHLAASLHDLGVIMSKTKRTERGDIEIVRGLLWHSPIDPFTPCRCLSRGQIEEPREPCTENHDPVQALFPKDLIRGSILFPSPRKPENLNSNGAIVFGHTMSWPSNHTLIQIGDIASQEPSSPDHPNAQGTISEAKIPITSLALDRSYSRRSVGIYGESTRTLHSADIRTITPERYTIGHTVSPLANSQKDMADTSEEETEEPEDSWGKRWWETSQLSRGELRRGAAFEYRN